VKIKLESGDWECLEDTQTKQKFQFKSIIVRNTSKWTEKEGWTSLKVQLFLAIFQHHSE